MGRPLKKSFFGTGSGNQIKVRAKIGSAAEGDGSIVKQTGTNRYVVKVGADTGVCMIVDKANGSLAAGEMTISVKDANNVVKQVKNVKGHTLVLDTGELVAWSFAAAAGTKVQMAEEATSLVPVITIGTQPANASVEEGDTATFTVAATVTLGATLSYQWKKNGTNISGATSASYTTPVTTLADDEASFTVVVSATGGASSVTSSAAVLTVTAGV